MYRKINLYKKIFLWLLLFLLGVYTWGMTQPTWSVDDVINQESVSDMVFSSQGGLSLVWVKDRIDKKKNQKVNDLYLTLLDVREGNSNKTIRLTRGSDSDYDPVFSKDGEKIYFLSTRDDGKKIWSLNFLGGDIEEVYKFHSSISQLRWKDGHTLLFLSDEGKTNYEKEREKRKDKAMVIEDTLHVKSKRIYAYNLKSKITTRITDNHYSVSFYEVSHNGRWLVTAIRRYLNINQENPLSVMKYKLWDLKEGKSRTILDGYQAPGNFQFDLDNKGLYFTAVKSSDPQWEGAGISLLYYLSLADHQVSSISLNWPLGMSGGYWVSKNGVLVSLADRTLRQLRFYRKHKNKWTSYEVKSKGMEGYIDVLAVDKNHEKIVFRYSTSSRYPSYHVASLKSRRSGYELSGIADIFRLNSYLDSKHKARTEIIYWQGGNGEEVNGLLFYPKDYKPGRRYPLIVSIHGGPSSVDLDRWSERWAYYPHLLSEKGVFILKPNYHGSSNHGLDFVESIKGQYYDLEMQDIIGGINHLIQQGYVDQDSIGAKGWSNGAILTTMMTIRYPDMFRFAIPGAGDVNWTSDFGTCSFGVTFDQSYFGGAPWDNVDGESFNKEYIIRSPLFEMEKVRTPTLIFHGSEDRAVPRDQGWEYYRSLQHIGKADVRFLWFPNERHGLRKLSHQRRKMVEELAWIDKYLFQKLTRTNDTKKAKTPLALKMAYDKAAQHNGLAGRLYQNKLIPEVVSLGHDSIAIGRFELTKAQYGAFDTSYEYDILEGNYPITGLSIGQIQDYLSWLNKLTREVYRLPNENEVKHFSQLIKKNISSGNTLFYWAGYKLTYDETHSFRKLIEAYSHSLLLPVGSFAPLSFKKGVHLYDIVGNAQEWFQAKDGIIHHYGYSAVSYPDSFSSPPIKVTDQGYIGFRVVRQ